MRLQIVIGTGFTAIRITWQEHRAGLVGHLAVSRSIGTVSRDKVGLLYEELLLIAGKQAPIPVVDGIVELVLCLAELYLAICIQLF